jgi:hypothetical protein
MKRLLIALLPISSLLLAGALAAFQGAPRCTAVDPDTAKTGDTVNATCENVNKSTVADLLLTDGKDDTKISVTQQTADKITFQVPRLKPGRYHIAFLTANKASIIEQPVVLTVE